MQVSFTLPIAKSAVATEAAKRYVSQMGIREPYVTLAEAIAPEFTYFVVYGRATHDVDVSAITAEEAPAAALDREEIDAEIARRFGRRLIVLGCALESDAHTVGLDAIFNMKGFAGDYGLERYHGFDARNLGAQVPVAEVARQVRETKADAVLVSATVTQNEIHIRHLTDLVDMLEAERLRDRVVLDRGRRARGPRAGQGARLRRGLRPGHDGVARGGVPARGALAPPRRLRSGVLSAPERVVLRLRVGAEQAHYGGGLVDGAFVLKLFGDAATELLIRHDGDEGLFRAYSSVDFLAPVHGGDYLEIEAEITRVGQDLARDALRGAPRDRARRGLLGVARRPAGRRGARRGDLRRPARQAAEPRVSDALLITVAGVGAEVMRAQQPHLPLLPEEVGEEYGRAFDAGATIGHVHGRKPDGTPDPGPRDVPRLLGRDPRRAARSSSSSRPAARWAWASRSGSRRSCSSPTWPR